MKIDRPQVQRPVDPYKVQISGDGKAARANQVERPAAQGDTVALSSKAQEVGRLRQQLRKAPDVRLELVERIKAQVEAGTYNVDPKDVAEKLLRSKVLDA